MLNQLDVSSWGLFCGEEGRQLVRIDDEACGPVSARKVTRALPRRLLLDENRVAQAFRTGEALTEEVTCGTTLYTIEIRPLFAPKSKTVIAVYAGVWPVNESTPEPPEVGCWEWVIEREENGSPSVRKRTYWDEGLFKIYSLDSSLAQAFPGYWDAGTWMNQLVDQADKLRLNTSIREGVHDGLAGVTGRVRCLTYHAVTGYGSSRPGRRHLRLVGHFVPVESQDMNIVLQGFSYPVPEWFQDLALEQDAARVDDALGAVLELAQSPIAIVDTTTFEVLSSSLVWQQEGLGHNGPMGGMSNRLVGDPEIVKRFLRVAAQDVESPHSTTLDVWLSDGSVGQVTLTVLGVRGTGPGRDAVVRIDL